MRIPKYGTKQFFIFKYAVLSLYVIVPIFAFLLGTRYQEYRYKLSRQIPTPSIQQAMIPSVPVKQPAPSEEKKTIQGIVNLYEPPPEFIDDAPYTLHVVDRNNVLFDILLPAGESACPIVPERNEVLSKLKKGDSVEIYGTAATSERIIVCYADEYVRLLNSEL